MPEEEQQVEAAFEEARGHGARDVQDIAQFKAWTREHLRQWIPHTALLQLIEIPTRLKGRSFLNELQTRSLRLATR